MREGLADASDFKQCQGYINSLAGRGLKHVCVLKLEHMNYIKMLVVNKHKACAWVLF